MLDNIKWAAGEFHCALGSSNPSRIRRTNQNSALSSLQSETFSPVQLFFVISEIFGGFWTKATFGSRPAASRHTSNSGPPGILARTLSRLGFAFSKCGLHRPNTRRRKTEPRHARGARQGGHAADVKLLKAVATLLHPLMTVGQDTEEEKWHFAAWRSNHRPAAHRLRASRSPQQCSQRYDTRGKVLGVTCAST